MKSATPVETLQAVVRDLYQLWPGLTVSVELRPHVVVRGGGRTTSKPLDLARVVSGDDDAAADDVIAYVDDAVISAVRVHEELHD